jgi:hypothetical protein
MKTFEAFYGSFSQQPLLLWLVAAAGMVVVARDRGASRSLHAFALAWGIVPFFDAWLTADTVAGVGALSATVGTAVATFFVIVGDLRVFLFLEGAREDGAVALSGAKWARAIGWSLVVPVLSAVVRGFLPDAPWRARAVFLVYEVLFLGVMGIWLIRPRAAPTWSGRVIAYVMTYYALWALSDAVILGTGWDAGYLVRVLPNVMYYGWLLAVMTRAAPTRASAAAVAEVSSGE